jgi:membrane associated rhomboid family serine protease
MNNSLAKRTDSPGILAELKLQGALLLGIVILFWLIEIVDLVIFGGALDGLGIRPRSADGLLGILFAPFLHGGIAHVAANSLPFIVLGWLIMARETWHFFAVAAISMVVGGLGVWLIGAGSSVHIGASGVVFGFFGFLLLAGWFERKVSTIAISLIVALTYGGLIFGVLPGQAGISWEGHLFGFLGGVLAARLLARRPRS